MRIVFDAQLNCLRKLRPERLPDGCVHRLPRAQRQPDDRVDKMLANVEDRRSRCYMHTYSVGRRLCLAFVDCDPSRLRHLLTARLLPADLSRSAA